MSKEKNYIDQFVKLFMEEESLKEQIKDVADKAKEDELNVQGLKVVAKAIVANKVDELVEKSEAIISLTKL